MRPALESILSTPAAMQNMLDNEVAKEVISGVLNNPANPGYLPVSGEVWKVLKEKRNTQLLEIRAKRNFARVHTV